MSDFLNILTHGRRLQAAVKELSLEELNEVANKLNNIIENRKKKDAEQIAAEQNKQTKLDDILKQLADAGIALADLQANNSGKTSKRVGQKRPVKYQLVDPDGKQHSWTGIGRMPLVYSAALAEGKSLDEFKV
ncbi:MAG: DNA-binding protein H-NS [Paraglaciecola sp.]|jgi:DNA-binding protein H-NS